MAPPSRVVQCQLTDALSYFEQTPSTVSKQRHEEAAACVHHAAGTQHVLICCCCCCCYAEDAGQALSAAFQSHQAATAFTLEVALRTHMTFANKYAAEGETLFAEHWLLRESAIAIQRMVKHGWTNTQQQLKQL